MKPLSFLFAFAGVFLVWPALAADTVNINNQAVTPGESAAQCYHDATEHLRKGEWFERAAIQLKEAARQDPKNVDYHLALGCAYADRVASLGWALTWNDLLARDKKQYPTDLANWQKDQTDPKADDYGKPAPAPPPSAILIKDDGKPLDLTKPQTGQQMQALCKQALDEWKQAIQLSATPKAKAECEYTQGWGMLILEGYADTEAMAGYSVAQPMVLSGFPTHKDIVNSMEAATRDDPSQAIYWQSLGDILGRPSDDPAADDSIRDSGHSGMAAYRKALAINPKNAILLYYLSQYEVRSHPDQAIADLKAAIASDTTNAFPIYVLASIYMRPTRYQNIQEQPRPENLSPDQWATNVAASLTDQDREAASKAFALLDQADEAPFCHYPVYHPAVPDLLNATYDYKFRTWFEEPALSPLRILARDIAGYADVAALQEETDRAVESDRRIVAIGRKLIGNWSIAQDTFNGHSPMIVFTGISIAGIGYNDMTRNASCYPDSSVADAVKVEFDAFTAERKAFGTAAISLSNFYSNY